MRCKGATLDPLSSAGISPRGGSILETTCPVTALIRQLLHSCNQKARGATRHILLEWNLSRSLLFLYCYLSWADCASYCGFFVAIKFCRRGRNRLGRRIFLCAWRQLQKENTDSHARRTGDVSEGPELVQSCLRLYDFSRPILSICISHSEYLGDALTLASLPDRSDYRT